MNNRNNGLERLVFHSLSELNQPIYVIDDKGDILYANQAASEYMGCSQEELLDKNVCDIDYYHISHSDFENQWKYIQTEDFRKIRRFESVHRNSMGEKIPVEVQPAFFELEGRKYCTVLIRNIEQEKNFSEEIELLQNMINESHDMFFVVRMSDGYIVYANNTVFEKSGYTLQEMREIGIDGFRIPLDEKDDYYSHSQILQQKKTMVDYATFRRKDGSIFHTEARLKVLKFKEEEYNVAIVSDISDSVEKEQKLRDINASLDRLVQERTFELSESLSVLESYKMAIDVNSIVSKTDRHGRITYVNDIFCKVSGYSAEEALGRKHNINRHPDNDSSIYKDLWSTINSKKPWKGVIRNLSKDKETYYIDAAILPILSSEGKILEFIAVAHDITELVNQKDQYKMLLLFDTLTGYGNREKLIGDLEAAETDQVLALVDINSFNTINDFYGLGYGDKVIVEFGRFLNDMLGPEFKLYRLHGDQFAVRCCASDKGALAAVLESCISYFSGKPLIVENRKITLNITVSISAEPKETIISTADLAKRYAKKHGYGYIEYSEALGVEKNISENMKNAAVLQSAFNDDRVLLFYQPILDAVTNTVDKYECLVRIENGKGEILPPAQFLETAKRSRMYSRLSQIIISKAFDTAVKYPDKTFSLNITLEDILDESTRQMILHRLKAAASEKIIFEIVESEEIRNQVGVMEFFREIKNLGAKIAIDDFGTGYSNFEYLIKIQADYVKIDGSLIRNIHTDKSSLAIVELIAEFSKKMNMKTIAEFVSEEAVSDILKKLRIDFMQGYLIGKPEPDILSHYEM